MEGGNFEGCDFSFADLQFANVRGSNLAQANFSGTDLRDVVYNEKTQWPDGFNPLDHGAIPVEWLPSDPVYEEDKE